MTLTVIHKSHELLWFWVVVGHKANHQKYVYLYRVLVGESKIEAIQPSMRFLDIIQILNPSKSPNLTFLFTQKVAC